MQSEMFSLVLHLSAAFSALIGMICGFIFWLLLFTRSAR